VLAVVVVVFPAMLVWFCGYALLVGGGAAVESIIDAWRSRGGR